MINLIIALIVIGVVVFIIGLIPMDTRIRLAIQAIAVALALVYALRTLLPAAGLG
jgi:hypothetical protein